MGRKLPIAAHAPRLLQELNRAVAEGERGPVPKMDLFVLPAKLSGRVRPHGGRRGWRYLMSAMKTIAMGGILGAGIFLQGCGVAVVSRIRSKLDHGYYRGRRDSKGDVLHGRGDDVFQHPVRAIERKNIRTSTVFVTNVHRNYAARNNVNRAVVRCTDSSMDA